MIAGMFLDFMCHTSGGMFKKKQIKCREIKAACSPILWSLFSIARIVRSVASFDKYVKTRRITTDDKRRPSFSSSLHEK